MFLADRIDPNLAKKAKDPGKRYIDYLSGSFLRIQKINRQKNCE
jgi:hypothetical protein